jgi:gluconolactonase
MVPLTTSLRTLEDVCLIATGLDHPECVNFGPDGRGYAGGEAGQVFRLASDGTTECFGSTGGGIGGLCVDGNHNVYECNYGLPYVHRVSPDGLVSIYSKGTPDRPAVLPNYPVFDSRGNLYYSDSGHLDTPDGCLFVVRPDGSTEHLFGDNLHFPNGLAIDPEERYLYVIQSTASNILRFSLRDGYLDKPEIFATLAGTVPDGLAFAASGNLYVACYVPDLILRITPGRHIERVVEDHAADRLNRPTNVAFEPGTTRLWFANLGGFSVNAVDVGESGMPLRYPVLV